MSGHSSKRSHPTNVRSALTYLLPQLKPLGEILLDTVSSAAAVSDAVVTAMLGSTLRSTWTRMTWSFDAPSSVAASTYWARACSRAAAREIGRAHV